MRLSDFVRKASLDRMPGGLGDQKDDSDFDKGQLDKGQKVEMEHTDDPEIAREIARDHLTENPKYYDELEKIEGPHGSLSLGRFVRTARAFTFVRQAAPNAGDWVASKHKRKHPRTGDPHPSGGVYIFRKSVQGVREALPSLLNEGVRIGRVMKAGRPDPGQVWIVEVYKPGVNTMAREDEGKWTLDTSGERPQALSVHTLEDQLTWTGDVYPSWDDALVAYSGL